MSLQTRSLDMFSLGVKTETLLESKNLRFRIFNVFQGKAGCTTSLPWLCKVQVFIIAAMSE